MLNPLFKNTCNHQRIIPQKLLIRYLLNINLLIFRIQKN
jgi:hypothetical protein